MDLNHVDAILSVSPHYVRPTQKGIIAHFEALTDAFTKPIVLYNVPSRTGTNMSSQTTLTLAQHPNIIGIKEASGNVAQCMEIAAQKPTDFQLISGDDMLTLPIVSVGGVGVISVIANALPEMFYKSVHAALAYRFQEAQALYYPLLKATQLLFEEGNPAGVKAICQLKGLCHDALRLPLLGISDALHEKIEEQLILLATHTASVS